MKFQYFTFFLNPIDSHLFSTNKNKINIFLDALKTSEPVNYKNKTSSMAYVYEKELDGFIFARIGRQSLIRRNLPPEKQFEEKQEESWPYCNILFNLSEDPKTGQRIAFEYKPSVFSSPYEQLRAFADKMNETLFMQGYAIAINPISNETKFWDLIDEYDGSIEKITLAFNAPNLFKLTNTLNEDLSKMQKELNMTKTTIEIENINGKLIIPKNDELFVEGIDYIGRGGGEYSVKIKGKGKKIIRSKNSVQIKSFDFNDFELIANDEESFKLALRKIF